MSIAASARSLVTRSQDLPKITKSFLQRQTVREFIAEFIGTVCLIAVGNGAIATYLLKTNGLGLDTLSICLSFGVGALIGAAASINISGAHINPAVTVGFASIGKFKWSKVWYYLLAQYLGGFIASLIIYVTYIDGISAYDDGNHTAYGHNKSTGWIFATYPAPSLTIFGALVDQIIGTAFLMFGILSIVDEKALNVPKSMVPFLSALIITCVCIAFNYNCGAILNPARDLAPRFFSAIAGWGWEPFQPLGGHYWYVAGVVGPHLGGILGAWIFTLTIDDKFISTQEVDKEIEASPKEAEQHKQTRLTMINNKSNISPIESHQS